MIDGDSVGFEDATPLWGLGNRDTQAKLAKEKGVFVAASDYMKILSDGIAKWVPGHFQMLGTDGFGRSEDRVRLRDFFEVDARYIALGALTQLAKDIILDGQKEIDL